MKIGQCSLTSKISGQQELKGLEVCFTCLSTSKMYHTLTKSGIAQENKQTNKETSITLNVKLKFVDNHISSLNI